MSGPFESPEKKPERPPGREKPKPCRACKGTGYLKGKTCKYCGGSGVDNPNAEGQASLVKDRSGKCALPDRVNGKFRTLQMSFCDKLF